VDQRATAEVTPQFPSGPSEEQRMRGVVVYGARHDSGSTWGSMTFAPFTN
jgi:hypothetical protein